MDDVDIGPQIGQGAFSKVYLGRYLGELVAVKKQARREADLEAYLMRELAVLKHFQHENLLQYVGASNAESVEPGGLGHVFIVTELACGGDLLALLLSEGEVGWKLRVSILTDAARALEFLHRKSLIHRDIKSPNILLDSRNRCKIADFGMARQIGTDMTVVGTDAYMAPELMFDNPYGTSADMFSFGIVLWEAIYRQKAGADEFIERRMADQFELDVQTLQEDAPTDASPSLVALAAQLIEYDPDQRPTAEDTLLWLEDLSDALPEDVEPPRTPIDYESLFPLEMGEREFCRLVTATIIVTARARVKAKSTETRTFSSAPGRVRAAARVKDEAGSGSRVCSDVYNTASPVSPGAPRPGRRSTLGAALNSSKMEGRSGGTGSMKRAQSCINGTGDDKHLPASCSDRQFELCTCFLFVCMQAGLAVGRSGGGSGSSGSSGVGAGAGGRRREAGLKRGHSPRGTTMSDGVLVTGSRTPQAAGTSSFRAIGASHAPITRQGYLYKKGKSGLKNWQKRWFVLEGSKLIWYKDSKSYPREPRGFLELKGCFLVKGSAQRWKILSADATAEQDDYNREIGAKTLQDMNGWMKSLQEAIDGADTGEGPAGIMLPVLRDQEKELDRHLYHATKDGYRTDMSVQDWLESLGLGFLTEAFLSAGYSDFVIIQQEMGLTDEDLAFVGVKDAAQRKALKIGARGLVEPMLHVEINGFFNFHSELVYRVDSKWRYLRASTFFEFSEFDDLHRRLKMAMKDTKFYKMMPSLPQRPNSKKIGTNDHARQARAWDVQHELKGYMQKLVMLVGTKEPYFTVLCGMLDLLPPDPHRLPVREDDFLAQIQTRINQRGGGGGGGGVAAAGGISSGGGGVGGRGVGRVNGGNPAKPASKQGSLPPKGAASSLRRQSYGDYGGYGNGSERPRSIGSTASAKRKDRLSSGSAGG
ncbi:unnamed protein product, partial [Ascophyllum nodosum]